MNFKTVEHNTKHFLQLLKANVTKGPIPKHTFILTLLCILANILQIRFQKLALLTYINLSKRGLDIKNVNMFEILFKKRTISPHPVT